MLVRRLFRPADEKPVATFGRRFLQGWRAMRHRFAALRPLEPPDGSPREAAGRKGR